jgi:hypothetical protein
VTTPGSDTTPSDTTPSDHPPWIKVTCQISAQWLGYFGNHGAGCLAGGRRYQKPKTRRLFWDLYT